MTSKLEASLFRAELAAVSRSFYLTIRVLPSQIQRPIGLAYLLARASDTVADSASVSSDVSAGVLQRFGEALHGNIRAEAIFGDGMADHFLNEVPDPAERHLLSRVPAFIGYLGDSEPETREEILWVLREIVRGQTLDVQRFSRASGVVVALQTPAELEDYLFSVAGCVGEFWTRLCCRLLPRYSKLGPEELLPLGIAFGKGLQLVNVLRDFRADLEIGRCYLPAPELGGPVAQLKANPHLASASYAHWLAVAESYLARAADYIEALRPARLRLACFLPWALGLKTLTLLKQNRPTEGAPRVKVPRSEVKGLLVQGAAAAISPTYFAHCRRVLEGR